MDIRKPDQQDQQTTSSESTKEQVKFKAGVAKTSDAKILIPPAIQSKLTALGSKYGVPFDLANIALDGKMAENVKAIRKIADMVEGDSKLLPEMLKQIRRLMRAEIKLAQFHKLLVKAAIKHQERLDKETAEIFLMMAGYKSSATKLEHRTNVRNQLKEKRTAAYVSYYDKTVYGEESKLIDVEFEVLESNKKILTDAKAERVRLNGERQQKINDYVMSAYRD
jgi:hypothetical protein